MITIIGVAQILGNAKENGLSNNFLEGGSYFFADKFHSLGGSNIWGTKYPYLVKEKT